jgi:hypothetical protein
VRGQRAGIGKSNAAPLYLPNLIAAMVADGLTVSVKFEGDREPYAFRRDELKLESAGGGSGKPPHRF